MHWRGVIERGRLAHGLHQDSEITVRVRVQVQAGQRIRQRHEMHRSVRSAPGHLDGQSSLHGASQTLAHHSLRTVPASLHIIPRKELFEHDCHLDLGKGLPHAASWTGVERGQLVCARLVFHLEPPLGSEDRGVGSPTVFEARHDPGREEDEVALSHEGPVGEHVGVRGSVLDHLGGHGRI
jgi:hypothetical protein